MHSSSGDHRSLHGARCTRPQRPGGTTRVDVCGPVGRHQFRELGGASAAQHGLLRGRVGRGLLHPGVRRSHGGDMGARRPHRPRTARHVGHRERPRVLSLHGETALHPDLAPTPPPIAQASCNPERHLRAAQALGADVRGAAPEDAGEVLAMTLLDLMQKCRMPNGLGDLGYCEHDLTALTSGAWPQRRLLDNAPLDVTEADLRALFGDSMRFW